MDMNFASLPFDEAMDYFRQKVNLPTERWTDLWEGMHSRAFVVAGAMKGELLSDLRAAIDKAIAEGTTITDFRKAFDDTVKRNGWSYRGSRGWRTGVIFNTNLRVAYSAGHYRQMTDPDVLKARPYWRYIGGLSEHPRPLHRSWSGTVLPADDPWWDTHFTPNGWGCKCKVVSHSRPEIERDGLKVSDKAPDDGFYEWTDKETGEVVKVPNGIDPGWAYNPGKAAWGQRLAEETMSSWKAQGANAWERLTPGNWETYGRPEKAPAVKAKKALDYGIERSVKGMEGALKGILGGEERIFSFKEGSFRHDVLVNAKSLASHLEPGRAAYLPLLPETLDDPYEVWMSFERHKGTGKVILRQRIIKVLKAGKEKGLLVVTNSVNGIMEAWTLIPVNETEYLNRQRIGKLIWKK